MNQATSIQRRIDALRRKCTTGYSCGGACISLSKECRTLPGSSLGKQRLERLLALAAGGTSDQRGIAPVRAQEAGELAGSITSRRRELLGKVGKRARSMPGNWGGSNNASIWTKRKARNRGLSSRPKDTINNPSKTNPSLQRRIAYK